MKKIGLLFLLLSFFSTSTFANVGKKQIRLRILDTLSTVYDETNIYLDLGSTSAYSYPEDGQKIVDTSSGAPYIYSFTSNNIPCFSNSYGNFTNPVSIPIGFRVGSSGTFRFMTTFLDNFDATSIVQLEDKTLGVFHDLRQGDFELAFAQAQTDDNRFVLHVSYPAIISTADADCNNTNAIITITQDTSIVWSLCALYDDSLNLLNSFSNINGVFNFASLTEGNYNLVFAFGVYTTIFPVSVNGHQIVVDAMASKYYAAVDESIHFSVLASHANHFVWDFGDGTLITGVANTDNYYPTAGEYLVTITCSNNYGCSAMDTFSVFIAASTGVPTLSDNAISINAKGKSITILNRSQEELTFQLFNTAGSLLDSRMITTPTSDINLPSLTSGLYILQLKSTNGNLTKKIFFN
ncbi:MAG: PKD domain-containing protein [Bacteroidetes bacterium]|nr:PKD domain-containing protein [Bacteroidota bacterium]